MNRATFKKEDYRIIFRAILLNYKKENPEFSLRALAKKIGLAPSMLSDVMAGKKILSFERAESILVSLGVKSPRMEEEQSSDLLNEFFSEILRSNDEEARRLVGEFLQRGHASGSP